MKVTQRAISTTPIVIHSLESVTIIPSADAQGTISVPTQGVADPIVPGRTVTYGGYSIRTTVILNLTSGSADTIVNPAGSAYVSGAQAAAGGFQTPPTRSNGIAKLMASSGGAAASSHTFSQQKQALGAYSGYRAVYANFDVTAALTITLAKACGSPADLGDGSTGTYATLATALNVPQATPGGAVNPNIVPGLAVTPWVIQSNVPRTDTPSANPLLLVASYIAAACTVGNVGTNAPLEIASQYGYQEAAGVASGDAVTTPTVSHAMTRNGNLFHPCAAIEFLYDQPAVTVASVGDSLMRGQNDSAGANGFRSLDMRVCGLKNAQNTGKIWSPCTFALSGQTHTPSYSVGLWVAQNLQPRFLIFRNYTVNDATTAAAFDNDYAETAILVDTCIKAGVTPILLTTGGVDGFSSANAQLLAGSNARMLALRSAGAIVIDVAGQFYDANLHLLPAWYGADTAHTHPSDAMYDAIAAQIAASIS